MEMVDRDPEWYVMGPPGLKLTGIAKLLEASLHFIPQILSEEGSPSVWPPVPPWVGWVGQG